jgi:hypothetical protein
MSERYASRQPGATRVGSGTELRKRSEADSDSSAATMRIEKTIKVHSFQSLPAPDE